MPSSKPRRDLPLIATGFLLTFWSSPGQTFFISLFGDHLRMLLELGHAQFGLIYSAATLASAVALLWSGSLIDRYPLPRVTLAVIVSLALSMMLLASASSIALLFAAFFLLRHFGQGMMMLIASSSIVRYLDNMRGRGSALSSMGYICAEALMPATIIWLVANYNWQLALVLAALVLLVFMAPLALWLLRGHDQRHQRYLESIRQPAQARHSPVQVHPGQQSQRPLRHWTRGEVLRDTAFYSVLPLMLAHPMIFTGFIFHQLHLVESKGWSLALWGQLFAVYATSGIVAKLLAGFAIDRFSAIRVLPLGVLPLFAGLLILAFSSSTQAAWFFMIMLGLTTGTQSTVAAPFWVEMYGSQHIASIKSVTTFAVVAGTAVSPVAMGWLIDNGVAIESIAIGSVFYLFVAILLALFALRLNHQRSQATG